MIDLQRFTNKRETIIPIVNGCGQELGNFRKIYATGHEDGWYKVTLGNDVSIDRKATPLEVLKTLEPMRKIQVYALGTEGVPLNFNNFKTRGFREVEQVHFMNLPAFSAAQVVPWDDGKLYFYDRIASKNARIIQRAKEAFERGEKLLDLRGYSPELRYYVLLLNLQREAFEALQQLNDSSFGAISDDERNKRVNEFRLNFSARLVGAIERSAGTYISHTKRGDGYDVVWEIGGRKIKSYIRDDLRIISAGFCLSGDDEKHTMNSIVNLARLFQKESYLNITRE